MSCVGTVKEGSHILAVYPNEKEETDEAFEFLKQGLLKDDVVMLITDIMSKDRILEKMSKDWNVDARKLESESDIIVKPTRDWYFPDGIVNAELVTKKWNALASMAIAKGRNGIRVFGDITGFFASGLSRELVEYETSLPATFQIPLTAICAYSVAEIGELEQETVERLIEHHGVFWA